MADRCRATNRVCVRVYLSSPLAPSALHSRGPRPDSMGLNGVTPGSPHPTPLISNKQKS